jgi:hypothetical protein
VLLVINPLLFIANSVPMVVSFPLVGNPSVSKKRFWTSQNDRIKDLKCVSVRRWL